MVGENIKRFRTQRHMTQDELAQQLNVTRQAVSNWENGKTQPDIDTLHKIAQILDVTMEELIYGSKQASTTVVKKTTVQQVTKGMSFGAALAMVISYVNWHSIGWAIFHGLLNWAYVIYFILRYGWN
ncbi:helix-turn-helix transcriptional regulator [Pseudoflavonifractor sp. An85]|uniref:helix-turn-helix transcriptional regulator n=1 Tax=Pseudoflavonifractor sp. An85 TaxID=1965661 RepID=UPI00117B71EE|nr:helix-turn-helix transcriptional regulator [Pseudoflavonifractor sp. An85]